MSIGRWRWVMARLPYMAANAASKIVEYADTGTYAGETHFLSDANFMNAPISSYRTKAFVPCLLMTDGVSDAFFDSIMPLKAQQHGNIYGKTYNKIMP